MGKRLWLLVVLGFMLGACASDGSPRIPMAHQTLALGSRCEAFKTELDPELEPGHAIKAPMPAAPKDASREGVACARVTINADGKVVHPEIVYTTNRLFARNLLLVLRHWRYTPTTRDGEPTEVRIMITAMYPGS